MTKEEFEHFKQVVESNLVTEMLNKLSENTESVISEIKKKEFITALLNYLILTKDYKNADYYLNDFIINSFDKIDFLPITYLREEKKLNAFEIDQFLFKNFIKSGYLYHVTKREYLDSILDKGLLSLNTRFNKKIYADCIDMNRCWKVIAFRNKLDTRDLILIPDMDRLYPERFDSVYLTTNLYVSLEESYTVGNEFFRNFMNSLTLRLSIGRDYRTKEELENFLLFKLDTLDIQDHEKKIVLNFCSKYYEREKVASYIQDSIIIMTPNQEIFDFNKLKHSYNYDRLVASAIDFTLNFQNCVDIECNHDIKPEGLIAITVEEDNSLKVHKKIKGGNSFYE